MKTCAHCNYTENPADAIFCVQCKKALPIVAQKPKEAPAIDVRRTTIFIPPPPETAESQVKKPVGLNEALKLAMPQRNRHQGKLGRNDIAIYVGDMEDPLIIPLTRETIVGRYGGEFTDQHAQVDLAAFGALERGVSRQHALLRRLGPDVGVVDLDSRNGTWLNGVKLQAHQSFMLRNGDRLLLSHLPIFVFVPETAPAAQTQASTLPSR